MVSTRQAKRSNAGEALGLGLPKSVREIMVHNFVRATEVAPNDVALAHQGTGMSQAEFAAALSISKRLIQEWEQGRQPHRA